MIFTRPTGRSDTYGQRGAGGVIVLDRPEVVVIRDPVWFERPESATRTRQDGSRSGNGGSANLWAGIRVGSAARIRYVEPPSTRPSMSCSTRNR